MTPAPISFLIATRLLLGSLVTAWHMLTPLAEEGGKRQFAALVDDEGMLRVMLACALFIVLLWPVLFFKPPHLGGK
jgi:hypothetical protein